MAGESVARRYARAIFELAIERGESLDDWLSDLRVADSALAEPSVAAVLSAPRVPTAAKLDIVDAAFQSAREMPRNFLKVLVDNGRVELLGTIVRAFQTLVNEHNGIIEAAITTAVPISDQEAGRVETLLGGVTGKRVIVTRRVDPTILGGVVARMGDTLINGSVAGRLAALRDQLT